MTDTPVHINSTDAEAEIEPVSLDASVVDRRGQLAKFLSRSLWRQLDDGNSTICPSEKEFDAAILFADVTGFTNLTERLMAQHKDQVAIGAEQLTLLLSQYFDHLVEVIYQHGGDVIKFAGDAMLVFFPDPQPKRSLKRALTAAMKMQEVSQKISTEIQKDLGVELNLKVTVSEGSVRGLVLGGVFDRWEFAVLSTGISDVGRLGDFAQPRDVLIGEKSLRILGDEISNTKQRSEGVWQLESVPKWDIGELNNPPSKSVKTVPEDKLKAFIPAAVVSRIMAGHSDSNLLGELRSVTVLFISLHGFNDDVDLAHAQKIVTTVQHVCYGQRGSLDKISCDDKGVSIIAGFGVPPMSADDDALRAVKAALHVHKSLQDLEVEASVGVATGQVYCGTLGDKLRREYTLMGDGVNTAARLMSKAQSSILCDQATADACGNLIKFDRAKTLKLKGKSSSVQAFQPLAIAEKVQRHSSSLIGRDHELALLRGAIESLDTQRYNPFFFIESDAGMGKSALLDVAINDVFAESNHQVIRSSASTVEVSFYGVWREVLFKLMAIDSSSTTSAREDCISNLIEQSETTETRSLPLLNDILGLHFEEDDQIKLMSGEIRAENIRVLIREIIRIAVAGQSLVIVIDDAQWMDSSSWEALNYLARSLRNVMFVVAKQPFSEDTPISYERILDLSSATKLTLQPFEKQEVQQQIQSLLKVEQVSEDLVSLVYERGNGHPLYTEVLVGDMHESGAIVLVDDCAQLHENIGSDSQIELPESIESAIVAQLERLEIDKQLALKTASVIGKRFSIDELHYIYPIDKSAASLVNELDGLSQAGWTRHQESQSDYLFTHQVTQKTAYQLMLFNQRKKLHAQVARFLELDTQALPSRYAEVAYHWRKAQEMDKALSYYDLAIQKAYALFANRETLNYLSEIEEILVNSNIDVPKIKLARWKAMGGAAVLSLGYPEKAQDYFNESLKILDVYLPASNFGFVFKTLGQIFKQIQHRFVPRLSRSINKDEIAKAHLSALVMERQFLVYYYLKNLGGLMYSAFASTNLAEATADNTATLSRTYATLGNAMAGIPLNAVSQYYINKSADVAAQVKEDDAWAWHHLAGGMCYAQEGHWTEFVNSMDQCKALSLKQGDTKRWEESSSVDCIGAILRGDFYSVTEAQNPYQRIFKSGFDRGVYQVQSWGYCMWTISAIAQGEYEVAERIASKLERLFQEHPDGFDPVNIMEASSCFATLAIRRNDLDTAVRYLELGTSEVKKWGRPTTWRSIPCSAIFAESLIRVFAVAGSQGQESTLTKIRPWVVDAIDLVKDHASIYGVAKSKYHLVQGWWNYAMGNVPRARKHWNKGGFLAVEFGMKFDQLLIGLALEMSHSLDLGKNSFSANQHLQNLAEQLGITDIDWHANWLQSEVGKPTEVEAQVRHYS